MRFPLTARGRSLGLIGLAVTLLSAGSRGATIEDTNTWAGLSITGPLLTAEPQPSHWRYWFDSQNKFGHHSRKLSQTGGRAGIGYTLDAHWSVWAGYGFTHNETPFSSVPYNEHRTFQQVLWSAQTGGFALNSRHRLEERFPRTGHDMGLRTRHLLRISHPIAGIAPLSWVVWDEVFLNLNTTDFGAKPGLDQNRLFGGFSWKLSDSTRADLGYMHNFNRRPGRDDRLNHVLAISLALSFQ